MPPIPLALAFRKLYLGLEGVMMVHNKLGFGWCQIERAI